MKRKYSKSYFLTKLIFHIKKNIRFLRFNFRRSLSKIIKLNFYKLIKGFSIYIRTLKLNLILPFYTKKIIRFLRYNFIKLLIKIKKLNLIKLTKGIKYFLSYLNFYVKYFLGKKHLKYVYSFFICLDKISYYLYKLLSLFIQYLRSFIFHLIRLYIKIFKKLKIKILKILRILKIISPRKTQPEINDSEVIDLGLLPPPPIWSRIFIWTLSLGSIFLITWSFVAKVEDTVTVTGEITTIKPKVVVNSTDQGVISRIYVKPNQRVEEGDYLLSFEDEETKLRINSARTRLDLLDSEAKVISDDYLIKMEKYNENYKVQSLLFQKLKNLYIAGAITEFEYLENESKVNQLLLDIKQLKIQFGRDLINNKKSTQEISSLLLELLEKKKRFNIKSPITGYILDLKYQTVGQIVKRDDQIASIIPEKDFIARVMIPSKLRAPVYLNMSATVEVDAFPSGDFGSIKSVITSLSPTSTSVSRQETQRSYMADLSLLGAESPEKLEISELRPGMSIIAKLKLRKKPVIASIFNILSDLFTPLSEEK